MAFDLKYWKLVDVIVIFDCYTDLDLINNLNYLKYKDWLDNFYRNCNFQINHLNRLGLDERLQKTDDHMLINYLDN